MADEHLFKQKRAGQPSAVLGRKQVGCARRALPHVDSNRDIQLFGQSEVGFE
jgi:hypothetical protein